MTQTNNGSAAAVRILALGDSYTIGESVPADQTWPCRLAALLRAQGIATAAPTVVARTGWTTDELSLGIDATRVSGPYDLVTLLIGVNNQYRGRAAAEYRSQLAALLDRATALAGFRAERVLLLSTPDWGVTPFAAGRDRADIAAGIDAYNVAARAEAGRTGAHFVDITPISRRASADPGLLATDGLHPSGTMYAEWAQLLLPVALAAMRRRASPHA
ncbi:MAG TPA: SGNH/GDSL hydrolase family protein [Gemmatimonadaceae bacterium]